MASAAEFLPDKVTLKALAEAASGCRGCPLYKDATQTVFGAGRSSARLMHFKWRPRGNRRLHQTPRAGEIEACKPWLEAEVKAVGPEAVLAMGATAARSLFGSKVKVTKDRGKPLESPLAPVAAVTIHPSAILRLRDHDGRAAEFGGFVADLEGIAAALDGAAR